MVSLEGFDATKVEPNGTFAPLPAGDYVCAITKSEKKPTKAGDGHYIALELAVLKGPHKGRTIKDNLNLWNKSQQASQIAQATLSAICHSVGVIKPGDTSELHNKPIQATVKCRKYKADDGTEAISNDVKGYAKAGSSPAAPDDSGHSETMNPSEDAERVEQSLETTTADAPWGKQ